MYIGMTNDLVRRVYEHKTKAVKGFTEKYNVNRLVYFEEGSDVHAAIAREKEIKKWRREKKNALVIQANPEWRDLAAAWAFPPTWATLVIASPVPSGARELARNLVKTRSHAEARDRGCTRKTISRICSRQGFLPAVEMTKGRSK
ncbi:MAG: GIY-YIG nuclease family protein [Sulfuricellaceae bacterium]|nr:GIY-YIG nuclease family protein [Sulfuricellaceae bacterium]